MALKQINSLTLFDAIFTPPIDTLPELPTEHMPIAADIVSHIIYSPRDTSYANLKSFADSKHDQYVAWLLASVTPWKGYMFPGKDTAKRIPAAATAVREGLKMVTKIYNTIIASYRHYEQIQDMVGQPGLCRREVGMFIRKLGADWRCQLLCAMVLETIPVWKVGAAPAPEAQKVLLKYSGFLSQIVAMGLEEAYDFKSILNVCGSPS